MHRHDHDRAFLVQLNELDGRLEQRTIQRRNNPLKVVTELVATICSGEAPAVQNMARVESLAAVVKRLAFFVVHESTNEDGTSVNRVFGTDALQAILNDIREKNAKDEEISLDDIALFLASDASRYVTGSTMMIDDGQGL